MGTGQEPHKGVFNLERHAWEGFEVMTRESWSALIKHVREKVEDYYWQANGQYPEFTIHVHRSDDDPGQ